MASNKSRKIDKDMITEILTADSESDIYGGKSEEENKILQRQWLKMQQTEGAEVQEEEIQKQEEEGEPQAGTSGRGVMIWKTHQRRNNNIYVFVGPPKELKKNYA
jgi:hypothetical protein